MMKAEVIAENRPDCSKCQECRLYGKEKTHEDEGGIQIFVVLLVEVFVVLIDLLLELVVETGSGVATAFLPQDRFQGTA